MDIYNLVRSAFSAADKLCESAYLMTGLIKYNAKHFINASALFEIADFHAIAFTLYAAFHLVKSVKPILAAFKKAWDWLKQLVAKR